MDKNILTTSVLVFLATFAISHFIKIESKGFDVFGINTGDPIRLIFVGSVSFFLFYAIFGMIED